MIAAFKVICIKIVFKHQKQTKEIHIRNESKSIIERKRIIQRKNHR